MEAPIQYDSSGRMQYHPEYHRNNGKPWSEEDLQYLIDWYYIIGPDEMSFALERTIATIMHMAYKLTKKGLMKKPAEVSYNKRVRKDGRWNGKEI